MIGSKSFSEQFILAELLARKVRAEGGTVSQRSGLGSAIVFEALASGDIDAYVDYSGTIWANVMRRTDVPTRDAILDEMRSWLAREHGIVLLGSLGFENAYALAMRRDRASSLGIESIADLAAHASRLRIGGDLEFFARPEWSAIRDGYGLSFESRREFESTFMYEAVTSGEVDVISAFTSDGRIAANDLVVLDDPRGVILPYDAIVLLAAKRAADPVLRRALTPLVDAISVALMREANYRVDRDVDKATPAAAARMARRSNSRRAAMRHALRDTSSLLLGMGILMLGAGLQGTLLGVRATLEGFSPLLIGAVMAAYYVGYVAGSLVAPSLIHRVGPHSCLRRTVLRDLRGDSLAIDFPASRQLGPCYARRPAHASPVSSSSQRAGSTTERKAATVALS